MALYGNHARGREPDVGGMSKNPAPTRRMDGYAQAVTGLSVVFAALEALPVGGSSGALGILLPIACVALGLMDLKALTLHPRLQSKAKLWLFIFWPLYLRYRAIGTRSGWWMYWTALASVLVALVFEAASTWAAINEINQALSAMVPS